MAASLLPEVSPKIFTAETLRAAAKQSQGIHLIPVSLRRTIKKFLRERKNGHMNRKVLLLSQSFNKIKYANLQLTASASRDLVENPFRPVVLRSGRWKIQSAYGDIGVKYSEDETVAYVASRMPAIYSACHRVLREVRRRVPEFSPSKVLDFGAGPGSALWAMREVWPRSLDRVNLVEPSKSMQRAAQSLLQVGYYSLLLYLLFIGVIDLKGLPVIHSYDSIQALNRSLDKHDRRHDLVISEKEKLSIGVGVLVELGERYNVEEVMEELKHPSFPKNSEASSTSMVSAETRKVEELKEASVTLEAIQPDDSVASVWFLGELRKIKQDAGDSSSKLLIAYIWLLLLLGGASPRAETSSITEISRLDYGYRIVLFFFLSYALGEIPSLSDRITILRQLWDLTQDVLVLLEPGTPHGSKIITQMRSYILWMENRKCRKKLGLSNSISSDVKSIVRQDDMLKDGAFVVAPCPHDGRCPLENTGKYCHFVQRLERTTSQRAYKRSKGEPLRGFEDEKFCFVALRRGSRPQAGWPLDGMEFETLKERLAKRNPEDLIIDFEDQFPTRNDEESSFENALVPYASDTAETNLFHQNDKEDYDEDVHANLGSGWGRIIYPPVRRGRQVQMDVCKSTKRDGSEGAFEHVVVTQRKNPDLHRQARRSHWGDLWPC
ncbi:hypothetical protein ZIOFF_041748 [Zingiber officinale]|uniref:Methyltransferase-like protein 17, mitochondrial n=1 Tax=Zingiber officinale TaxID=94328 RepID=A0A8J5KZ21_ZINOF|nr:hypothetical protein ZIOFF_041748 [Zingiber officinale]